MDKQLLIEAINKAVKCCEESFSLVVFHEHENYYSAYLEYQFNKDSEPHGFKFDCRIVDGVCEFDYSGEDIYEPITEAAMFKFLFLSMIERGDINAKA